LLLEPVPWLSTLLLLLGFVALRLVGKFVASRVISLGTPLRPDLYRGLLAHGEVTIAMAVSFRVVWHGPIADMAYAVVLASVVVHDLIAPRVLRQLLRDLGELTEDRDAEVVEAPDPDAPEPADAPFEEPT